MTTQVPRASSADFFDDEDAFDGAFDFATALENHLVESDSSPDVVVLAGDDATWIDAPVAMVEEGREPETVELETIELLIEVVDPVKTANTANDDPFAEWLQALVRAAEGASIFIHLEALRVFVNEGRAPYAAFPTSSAAALADGNIARLDGEELVATAAFLRIAAEWRRVLAGEGGDFSKCGARTFDEWSADFLARVLGTPARFEWLKRELRRHGVAAFGLVESAA
ncbi:hypothetical protein LZC95_38795 [Pendulispora brunnea]|uniref:Uncharacterized protein n=1 Tax=Pendulispora brunnea TaxID=2905690 RepID=A0ABZ2K599_9BACT